MSDQEKALRGLRSVIGDETVEVLEAVGAIIVPGGMPEPEPEPDFTVSNHGTVVVFSAMTEAAIAELEEMGLAGWQMIGEHAFGVDHRPAAQLVNQLRENGFTLEQR